MQSKHYVTRIYELCIEGLPAKKICSCIRRDKAQVSRVIKALVDGGFLICINQGDKVKFYEATKKPFTEEQGVILSTIRQKKTIKMNERGSYCRVHALRFISTVVKMGGVPWDKKWTCKGVDHCFINYPFLNVGDVGFEWIVGKQSNQLVIHVPSLWWDMNDGDPVPLLRNMADRAGSWFMKRYHCDLRGLRQCGKGHFEVPVRDKRLVSLAQVKSVRAGGFILDSSLGFPEFGSVEGFDPLAELMKSPSRISDIEDRIDRIERSVEKLTVSIERLTRIFDMPIRPDDKRDVA